MPLGNHTSARCSGGGSRTVGCGPDCRRAVRDRREPADAAGRQDARRCVSVSDEARLWPRARPSKYVAFDRITKSNVSQLRVAWTYPTGDTLNYQFNPIVVDNVMYVLAKNNSLVALNATTGEEIWIHANLRGISRRGVNYWESRDRTDRRLLLQINNYLQAIDAQTGKSILSFGENGLVVLKIGLSRDGSNVRAQSSTPGKIFENLLLLGSAVGEGYLSPPGHLRAFDVVTGKLDVREAAVRAACD